jgi:hypothetical protein
MMQTTTDGLGWDGRVPLDEQCVMGGCEAQKREDDLCVNHYYQQQQQAGAERVDEILSELVFSEKAYTGVMKSICRQFIMRLRALREIDKQVVTEKELISVFQNLEMLLDGELAFFLSLSLLYSFSLFVSLSRCFSLLSFSLFRVLNVG